jgi:hypothetical protein
MSNELEKVEKIEGEISIIEQSHKSAILAIHENMNQLVNDCLTIVVDEDDKERYDRAVELKRVVKATHVSIEKKRKELKQPLIDYGKRLDKWVEEIYSPLVNAEKVVKKKMEVYEAKQEKLKQEKKLVEEQKVKEELELETRLKNLNGQLEKINFAKNKAELKEIEVYLDSVVIADFGTKSGEAGFILNQLKLTCSMAFRAMKDEEVKPVEAPKMEATPITDDLVNGLKEMTVEPTKKVVIESEVSVGLFEEKTVEPIAIEENVIEERMVNDPSVGVIDEKPVEPIAVEQNVSEERMVSEPIHVEEGIFQENSDYTKATEDDVLALIDSVSVDVLKDVVSLITESTELLVNNKQVFSKIDYSSYKELIHNEVKMRIGVLLKNNQL